MQKYLSEMVKFQKEVKERQTTQQLRDEMYQQIEQVLAKLKEEENSRHTKEGELDDMDKDLQKQIN